MKHLKEYINESILSSTGAGVVGIAAQWLEEHNDTLSNIKPDFNKIKIVNGRINFDDKIDLQMVKEKIPKAIKFGDIYQFRFPQFKYIDKEQFPKNMFKSIMNLEELHDVDITCNIFSVGGDVSKYKNISLHRSKSAAYAANFDNFQIDFRDSNINKKSIKEFSTNEEVDYLLLSRSTLGREIYRIYTKMTNEELTEYLNDMLSTMPNIKCITLDGNNAIDHDLKTNTWKIVGR